MSDLKSANVLTVEMFNRGLELLRQPQPELPPEQTIGEPSEPMSDFERVIRHSWLMHGGRGNPPKVVLGEALAADVRKLGCPDHLITIVGKL